MRRSRSFCAIGVPWFVTTAIACASLLIPVLGSAKTRKEVIKSTMPSVALVMAIEVKDGKLVPVASGSGTIVSDDGAVLTNYHVINDAKGGGLYDLFVIGRFRAADREPEMLCAGRPNRGKLKPNLDLALIKCDADMSGRAWKPENWPVVPVGRSEDVVPGEQVWVLGYPNIGGSTIHITAGLVAGWTGEKGGAGSRAFMKTDAAITHGNSGGTAVDEEGNLIGVPTAIRVRTAKHGDTVATVGKVGLIRPIEHARDLLTIASEDWTPTEGENTIPDDTPTETKPKESKGAIVTSKVVEAANKRAVSHAVVVVFKQGVRVADINGENIEEHALAWGETNDGGVFMLKTPLPRGGTYSVAVIAKGFEPLALDDALKIPADAPDLYDPWEIIRLIRR
jgi:hypothetical protein